MPVISPGTKDTAVKKINMDLTFQWEENKNGKRKVDRGQEAREASQMRQKCHLVISAIQKIQGNVIENDLVGQGCFL